MKFSQYLYAACMLAVTVSGNIAVAGDDYSSIGKVHRYSDKLDSVLPRDAQVQQLTEEAFVWSEGPVWVPDGNYVLFSDVPQNIAYKWSEPDGLEVFLMPSAYVGNDGAENPNEGSNGLMMSLEGDLLMTDHGSRGLVSVDLASKDKSQLISHYEGKRFNSPNDLAISRKRWPGTLFFTDPPYGLKGQDESPEKELEFNGVYRLDPSGEVTLLDDSMGRPNGIGLSLDERLLYVANSEKERSVWLVFDLDKEGNVAGGPREFASAQKQADNDAKGLPDGLAIDVQGNIWASGPGGVYVIDPQGNFLGLIETGTAAANCAFGGEDGGTLYITSHKVLARVKTSTRGIEFQ